MPHPAVWSMLRGGRDNQPWAELLDRKKTIHLLTRISSQENFESNGHLSRNLSKFGKAELLDLQPKGRKARKSRRAKIASPGAAERHRGRLPPREDLRTVASPPQSDLRATNVAWQPHAAPGPRRPFRARRSRFERAPRERRRSAITTRPQVRRAADTYTHGGGGSKRLGRRGAGDGPSCVGNGFWPVAWRLRTCREPIPTCPKRVETCPSSNSGSGSPSRRPGMLLEPPCLRVGRTTLARPSRR